MLICSKEKKINVNVGPPSVTIVDEGWDVFETELQVTEDNGHYGKKKAQVVGTP